MISRRDILKALAAIGVGGTAFTGYAFAEASRHKIKRYALTPPRWTPGLQLRLAVLADFHVCEPWMSIERVDQIVAATNALRPDAVLLLGDYVVGHRLGRFSTEVSAGSWATSLARLHAPLGVHAVLGNHDWWDEIDVQRRRAGPTRAGLALQAVGIPVYENRAVRLEKSGQGFWIAGLGDQWAFWPRPEDYGAFKANGEKDYTGVDDLPVTFAHVTDDAPVILMAHEPDIFPQIPPRVSLTLSGHTHGGQIRILGWAPSVPSKFGARYIYGHKVEEGRHLIVSGGLGCSALPIRVGSEPEIVIVDMGSEDTA